LSLSIDLVQDLEVLLLIIRRIVEINLSRSFSKSRNAAELRSASRPRGCLGIVAGEKGTSKTSVLIEQESQLALLGPKSILWLDSSPFEHNSKEEFKK
jgi:hypothetical protein